MIANPVFGKQHLVDTAGRRLLAFILVARGLCLRIFQKPKLQYLALAAAVLVVVITLITEAMEAKVGTLQFT